MTMGYAGMTMGYAGMTARVQLIGKCSRPAFSGRPAGSFRFRDGPDAGFDDPFDNRFGSGFDNRF